jgi:acyl dehydratase
MLPGMTIEPAPAVPGATERRYTYYWEDFPAGPVRDFGGMTVSREAVLSFAAQFDPQPFHTDPQAAAAHRLFRGLAASGWHTAALSMRLFATSGPPIAGGIIGNGIDELRWPRPVRPGDPITLTCEVIELRPPEPGRSIGWLRMRNTTRNQAGEVVMSLVATLSVPRRPTNES